MMPLLKPLNVPVAYPSSLIEAPPAETGLPEDQTICASEQQPAQLPPASVGALPSMMIWTPNSLCPATTASGVGRAQVNAMRPRPVDLRVAATAEMLLATPHVS